MCGLHCEGVCITIHVQRIIYFTSYSSQLKKRGLKVQDVVYTGLFNACANSPWPTTDGLQRATQLRSQLTEKGYLVNQTSSHAMIKGKATYIIIV